MTNRDIFGEALLDYQAGRRGEVFTIRRDDGHTDRHDPALYFAPEPYAHERDLLDEALLDDALGPVLDVGCGAGRTLLWLEERGLAATGVDLSEGAVAVCRRRGCRDVRRIDAMAGLEAARDAAPFRTAVLFGNNVGIGGTREGSEALLRRIAEAMAPGGRLLVTALDIARTEAPHHLAYHERNRRAGRPRGEIRMRFEYRGSLGPWIPWFHPEPSELQELAAAAGWRVEDVALPGGLFYGMRLRMPG